MICVIRRLNNFLFVIVTNMKTCTYIHTYISLYYNVIHEFRQWSILRWLQIAKVWTFLYTHRQSCAYLYVCCTQLQRYSHIIIIGRRIFSRIKRKKKHLRYSKISYLLFYILFSCCYIKLGRKRFWCSRMRYPIKTVQVSRTKVLIFSGFNESSFYIWGRIILQPLYFPSLFRPLPLFHYRSKQSLVFL